MKRTFISVYVSVLLMLMGSSALAGSKSQFGTNSAYFYQDIGNRVAIIWSSGNINGTRTIDWSNDGSSFTYTWDLSSGGSIGRIGRDGGSGSLQPRRVDDCGDMDVSKTVTVVDQGGGDWNNMVYGYWGVSPNVFASAGGGSVEYYVIDSQDRFWLGNHEFLGKVFTNGSNYSCYRMDFRNDPNDNRNFAQYVALRDNQRSSGTVRLKTIFDFWRSKGAPNHYVNEIAVGSENFNGGRGEWRGSNIVIPNTGGTPTPPPPSDGDGLVNNAVYRLNNEWAGYLNATGTASGSNVDVSTLDPTWDSQRWRLERVSNNRYRLRDSWGNKYLTSTGTGNNANVTVTNLNTSAASQIWALERVSGNTYRLRSTRGSNKYLNAQGNTNGANVVVFDLNNGWGSQKWILERVPNNGREGNLVSKELTESVSVTSETEIGVYPNPASESLSIKKQGAFNLSIRDLTGRLVFTKHGLSDQSNVDVSHLNRGTYLIQVAEGSQVTTRRLILN